MLSIDDAAIQHGIVRYLRRRALRDGVGAGAGTGGRVDEGQGGHVDAQRQISRPPNVAFGVDRTGQVRVKVGSLGKREQERAQGERVLTDPGELFRDPTLSHAHGLRA